MSEEDDDLRAILSLVLAGGATANRLALLQAVGSPARILDVRPDQYRRAGLDPAQCQALRQPDQRRLDQSLQWLSGSQQRHVVWHGHPDYPSLLTKAPHPPLALFLEGERACLWQPAVAVVGSRAASHAGRGIAAELATQLCRSGLIVASGLAAGIDAAAHRASLAFNGRGIAVIGTGPDICYPAANRPLHAQLIEQGLVISEYLPGTPPRPAQFPARNRILAGLSMAVIVVEAAQRSGALLTARLAAEAGREVFAVPGSILSPQSRGCHRLLRDGAGLLESIEDLLPSLAPLVQEFGLELANQLDNDRPGALARHKNECAGPDEPVARRVWLALEHELIDMDELGLRTGLTVNDLSSILLGLELEGWVSCQHGRYLRSSQPATPNASTDAGRG